jgi:hypothetical protein
MIILSNFHDSSLLPLTIYPLRTRTRSSQAKWFIDSRKNQQCKGMKALGGAAELASRSACFEACCALEASYGTCMTWQWKATPATPPVNGYAGGGCFYDTKIHGTCMKPGDSGVGFPLGWYGAARGKFACDSSSVKNGTLVCVGGTSEEVAKGRKGKWKHIANFPYSDPGCNSTCAPGPALTKAHAIGVEIFAYAFLVMFGCYMAVGILSNRTQGQRGLMAIPNIGFWSELCSLARDGCRFSLRVPVKQNGQWHFKQVVDDYEAL